MIFEVAVAVCLLGSSQCDRLHNVNYHYMAEHAQGLPACMRDGQMWAAQQQLIPEGHYAKIFCRPKDNPPEGQA